MIWTARSLVNRPLALDGVPVADRFLFLACFMIREKWNQIQGLRTLKVLAVL